MTFCHHCPISTVHKATSTVVKRTVEDVNILDPALEGITRKPLRAALPVSVYVLVVSHRSRRLTTCPQLVELFGKAEETRTQNIIDSLSH